MSALRKLITELLFTTNDLALSRIAGEVARLFLPIPTSFRP